MHFFTGLFIFYVAIITSALLKKLSDHILTIALHIYIRNARNQTPSTSVPKLMENCTVTFNKPNDPPPPPLPLPPHIEILDSGVDKPNDDAMTVLFVRYLDKDTGATHEQRYILPEEHS